MAAAAAANAAAGAAAGSSASASGASATGPALIAVAAATSTLSLLPKSVLTELLTSGISVGTANTATNPLDVIKVRLQLERNRLAAEGPGARPPGMVSRTRGGLAEQDRLVLARGPAGSMALCACCACAPPHPQVQTGVNIVRNEGVLALWSGLGPSLARGFFFGGARLGLYTPIKNAITGALRARVRLRAATSSSRRRLLAVTLFVALLVARRRRQASEPGDEDPERQPERRPGGGRHVAH